MLLRWRIHHPLTCDRTVASIYEGIGLVVVGGRRKTPRETPWVRRGAWVIVLGRHDRLPTGIQPVARYCEWGRPTSAVRFVAYVLSA